MITATMFLIFFVLLAVGIPIAASVGWATLSVNFLDPSFACDAIYFVKTNLDFYNNLSDENKAILDAGIAAATEAATNYALENEASWTKEIEDHGCTIVDLTDAQREVFREAVAPEWDAVKDRVSSDVWNAYVD